MKTALQIWKENPLLQAALQNFTEVAGPQFVAAMMELQQPVLSVIPGTEGVMQDGRLHQVGVGYRAFAANIEQLLPAVIEQTLEKQIKTKELANERPYSYAKP